jgi:sigma-B regulation protein RsbU (phosphoserine phosphatase)
VVAILGAGLSLDFMTKILQEQDSIFGKDALILDREFGRFQSYVLLRDGTYLTHPEQRRILKGNFFVHVKDNDNPGMAEKIIKDMSEGKKSAFETQHSLKVNRKDTYLFYAPLTGTDWILTVTVPAVALDYIGMVIAIAMLMVIIFVVLVTYLVCCLTIKRATKPLKLLADTADKVAQGQFDTLLPNIKHHDEIHQLRDSFENMQHSLTDYIEELKDTTASKASMENELKIAHGIQMSMLPKTYPAFPDRNDIDIYGQVTPAKAVGGDLYDFFIRDEKLFFCIGDVSGKGVPASLVMAVTRSLFRNISSHVMEPDLIVKALNDTMADGNETSMFVTLFLGMLDLQTGILRYCNAGHDSPLLIGNEVSQLPCNPNLPIGVLSDWVFTCQEKQLKSKDTIYHKTDGINEAEDITQAQFGDSRIIRVANTCLSEGQVLPTALVNKMTEAVHRFVDGAEQSDDLTMLAIKYK